MMQSTIVEMFRYNDWANEQLLAIAAPLTDEQLDRPFEMGMGSLRKTLQHVYHAEWVWLERWKGVVQPPFPPPDDVSTLDKLRQCFAAATKQRGAFIDQLGEAGLARSISYRNVKGEQFSNRFGDMMHHVCNHGAHHRAQALNMLRQLGVKTSNIDYLLMKRREEPDRVVPEYDAGTLGRFFEYGDWANRRLLDAARGLSRKEWDQPFEMGMGSLRMTLIHISHAEAWWLRNWHEGPENLFPSGDRDLPPSDLGEFMASSAPARDAFLEAQEPADLQRPVSALVWKDMVMSFPLGASMMQLGFHGTHHRAQAVNMLRHLGVTAPPLDLIVWARENE